MMIYPTLGMTSMGKKSCDPQKGMSWINSCPQLMTQQAGTMVFKSSFWYALLTPPTNHRTSGFDKLTQSEQQLTAEELDIIRRLQAAENPDASYDPYEPLVEFY